MDIRWASFLERCGILPILIPSHATVEHYFERFSPDGVLLTGGEDLACVVDSPISRWRDRFEEEVVAQALRRELPVLGVCRGLQLLGWRFGMALEPVQGHVKTVHRIEVYSETRYLEGFNGLEVNSYHGVAPVGEGEELVVAARSSEGHVEALEHKRHALLGIMWHPERYEEARPQDVALISSFFGAAPVG